MRIVIPPLIVNKDDAFKNDIFNREAFGDALLNLVKRADDALVISLDGQWGEGKTTFVKMWRGLLNESKIPSIYIDAFANDYIDDPFISVASAITDFAEKNVKKNKADKFKETTKTVGGRLLSWSAKVGIKAATLGALKDTDIEELKNIKDDLSKGVSNVVGEFVEERLNSHSEDIELLESFKKLLSELPLQLKGGYEKPLVIIIDELDRCRPTYAVEMLEKIKHLFSVQNVVFVLVIHKMQLEEAVRCIYGSEIEAHTYLQKFINVETTLPKFKGEQHSNDLGKYCRRLLELHEFETWGDDRNIINTIEPLANHLNLSLRQLEKVFTNMAILYSSTEERYFRVAPLIVFVSVIKSIKTSLFHKMLSKGASYDEVCKEIGLTDEVEENESEDEMRLRFFMKWVKFGMLSEQEFKDLDDGDEAKGFTSALFKYNIHREGIIPLFMQQMCMFIVKE